MFRHRFHQTCTHKGSLSHCIFLFLFMSFDYTVLNDGPWRITTSNILHNICFSLLCSTIIIRYLNMINSFWSSPIEWPLQDGRRRFYLSQYRKRRRALDFSVHVCSLVTVMQRVCVDSRGNCISPHTFFTEAINMVEVKKGHKLCTWFPINSVKDLSLYTNPVIVMKKDQSLPGPVIVSTSKY